MLAWVDTSLERYLRDLVPLDPADVDVVFDAPTREWAGRRSRPTVNLFLWDLRRAKKASRSGVRVTVDGNGRPERRPAAPIFELHYLVTTWTSDVQDEHRVLGSILALALSEGELREPQLHESLRGAETPPKVEIGETDPKNRSELWSAVEGQLKPGLELVVTCEVPVETVQEAGPPMLRPTFRTGRLDVVGDPASLDLVTGFAPDVAPGSLVRSPRGTALVQDDGSFVIRACTDDRVEVVASSGRVLEAVVPAGGPVIV